MFEKFVGKKSDVVVNVIERGAVKRFAEAIGDLNPIFIDEEYGLKSIYNANIVPPTFVQNLEYGDVEGFYLPQEGLLHGEQGFEYERPLKVGEKINCFMQIGDYYESQGKSGVLTFLTRYRYGIEPNTKRRIFKITELTIISETVKKELIK